MDLDESKPTTRTIWEYPSVSFKEEKNSLFTRSFSSFLFSSSAC